MPDISVPGATVAGQSPAGASVSGAASPGASVPVVPAAPLVPAQGMPSITRADPRYLSLTTRSRNTRFTGRPDRVHVPRSAEDVRRAVTAAVRAGSRLAVRGGGHGLEGLVDDPAVRTLLDLSELKDVTYDPGRRAFGIGAGALLGSVYRSLYLNWGVAVPGGTCPSVGLGGYVQGGGFGALCRRHGLIVDHLEAVEVVVADGAGEARTVVASRDPADPHHSLWWAHTGAGGGNFGVVTRYWFRSPQAATDTPQDLLPGPPETVLFATAEWPWESLSEQDFARLVRNHGDWHREEDSTDPAYESLYSALYLNQRAVGRITLGAQLDGSEPGARGRLDEYIAAVGAGVRTPCRVTCTAMPWLAATQRDVENRGELTRSKSKGAYLRRPYSAVESELLFRYLSDPGYDGHTTVVLFSYGRQVNAVDPAATVVAQRDSVLKSYLGTYWTDPDDDERHIRRLQEFYRELYAETGGVPVSDAHTDGSYINYPDVDLADPRWNTSGVPWHALYFKGNYARLQRVKAVWDPHDVFRHALSVRASD
ncbi:FAD-binding oxidoreductase [Streptomyces sp. NBC_01361]|uniref:FAD-binding oxidoreductase n=1 Tax=Streptomyces sp. NBC_01361 TaxID=2903838 RepID=UPI002E3735A7|nr:FAD-binding protein [Streptomyces sp. NBC_01361]